MRGGEGSGTGLTYAVPDLHGRDDLLVEALEAIAAHAERGAGERKVVFLGDSIDRGPDSRKVLDRLMGGPPPEWRWICLKGNHEQMMVEACRGVEDPEIWLSNGGHATLKGFSLGWREIEPYEVPAPYVDWVDGLALMHVDRHRVYVHAGLDRNRALDEQRDEDLLWSRGASPDGFGRLHIVHGHNADPSGPRIMSGRTNLDTMAWRTGRLVVGCFEDERAGGASDIIEVRTAR